MDIQDRMFLVGPNASGKSNFLDAFRFLRDLASPGGGFGEAIRRRGGVGAIRCLAARKNPEVEICVELREDGKETSTLWQYELAFNQQDNRHQPLVSKERVSKDGEEILARPDKYDKVDNARLRQTYLEQVNANRHFRNLADFFATIRYLHIVPQLIREPDRSVGRSNDPFGGDFLEQVAKTNKKTMDARLTRIQKALRVAVPQLEKIEMIRDARGTPHLKGKYQHWRVHGAWQTEEQFSDGTLRLMGLLWAVMEKEGPLLLEEPEISLHPEIVRVLPQMLARVQQQTGRQIFLSTHAPELLYDEGIGLDETLLFSPNPEGTEVTSAKSRSDVCNLLGNGIPLAEIVHSKTRPKNVSQLTMFNE